MQYLMFYTATTVARTSLNVTLYVLHLSSCHLFSFSSFYDAVTAAEVLWLLTAYCTVVMTKDDALGCGKNMSWFVSEILVDVNQKDSNEHAHDYQSTRGQFGS